MFKIQTSTEHLITCKQTNKQINNCADNVEQQIFHCSDEKTQKLMENGQRNVCLGIIWRKTHGNAYIVPKVS